MDNKNLVIDDQTADAVVKRMLEVMPQLGVFMKAGDINMKFLIRFQPLAEKIKITRIKANLTIKQAAQKLKIAQYKIKQIEKASVNNIQLNILLAYVELLNMKKIFNYWAKGNQDVCVFFEKRK